MWYFNWREFEPQGIKDYLLIPWWLLRYRIFWCVARLLDPPGWGRWDGWEPVVCTRCFWAGPIRWAFHTRVGWGEDGEAEDECPRCGYGV